MTLALQFTLNYIPIKYKSPIKKMCHLRPVNLTKLCLCYQCDLINLKPILICDTFG